MQLRHAPCGEVLEARVAIEPVAASLAAVRISDEDIESLARSVTVMEEHFDNQPGFLRADREFHDVLAWASGNTALAHTVSALIAITSESMTGMGHPRSGRIEILAAHRGILEALQARDSQMTQARMIEHLDAMIRFAEATFPEFVSDVIPWAVT